jgi:hypothetical protein
LGIDSLFYRSETHPETGYRVRERKFVDYSSLVSSYLV